MFSPVGPDRAVSVEGAYRKLGVGEALQAMCSKPNTPYCQVTSGKSFCLSEPQFPLAVELRIIIAVSQSCLRINE